MAFGAPRFSVTLMNLSICILGLFLIIKFDGIVKNIGWGIFIFGVLVGALVGSWSMLIFGYKWSDKDKK